MYRGQKIPLLSLPWVNGTRNQLNLDNDSRNKTAMRGGDKKYTDKTALEKGEKEVQGKKFFALLI